MVSSGLKQLRRLLHYLHGCDANLAQVIHTISSGFSLCLWVERYTGSGKCDLHLFSHKGITSKSNIRLVRIREMIANSVSS